MENKTKFELAQHIANLIKMWEFYNAKGTADVDNYAFKLSCEIDRLSKRLKELKGF